MEDLQRVVVSITLQGVANTDLCTVDPLSTSVPSVGNANRDDSARGLQVQSPPRVGLSSILGVGAGTMMRVRVRVSIDGSACFSSM